MISEKQLYNLSNGWPKQAKQFIVAITLFFVAFLMIAAWILHLNWISDISYGAAFGMSRRPVATPNPSDYFVFCCV